MPVDGARYAIRVRGRLTDAVPGGVAARAAAGSTPIRARTVVSASIHGIPRTLVPRFRSRTSKHARPA